MAKDVETASRTLAERQQMTLRRYAEMATMIPEGDDDVELRMLEQIVDTEGAENLSKFWESQNTDGLVGHELEIVALKRQASNYEGGLGIFLVVDYVDQTTGEVGTFTSGSVAIVGQLVKAYASGWLPLSVIFRRATRPSKAGFYPEHLEIIRHKVPFPPA